MGDSCEYLARRWDPADSLPGTVVAPIMFHSILEGNEQPKFGQDINSVTFAALMSRAEDLGFETITTAELVGFLQNNTKIPPRSMVLILDDRRAGTAEEHFLPILEENNWTVTMAWIALSDTDQRQGTLAGESLWDTIERLYATGYLDIQAHGRDHVYLQEEMAEDVVRQEIVGSLPPLKEHFGVTPLAYIWPGGNYTPLGVQIAHEVGFELGFTVHSRGPLQFNWIPQGEQELAYNDPLMLLPRFWDSAALLNLDQTVAIGDAAQAFARENYAAEAAWFSQNCGGELPPLDAIFK